MAYKIRERVPQWEVESICVAELALGYNFMSAIGNGDQFDLLFSNTGLAVSGNITIQEPISVDDNGGFLSVDDGGGTLTVDGSVNVGNFPLVQPVSDNGGSITVDGVVSVSNFPAAYPVTDNGGSLTVDGSVSISNFPATQPVSGTVTVTDGAGSLTVDGSVTVSNLPAVQPVNDNGSSLTVDGTIAVSNFPATQPVSGTVTVQDSGGSISVDDGGSSLTVDGTVGISGNVSGKPYPVAAADILSGGTRVDNSTTSTAFLTIPAGRTWYGTISLSAINTAAVAAVGDSRVVTAGANATPSAGTILAISMASGSASGAGTSIVNAYVIAPAGNSVTLNLVNSTSTTFSGAASATGTML